MADTAVTEPGSDLQLRQLAARHGLHVAGARPNLLAYTKQLWTYRHFITEYANAKVVVAFSTARLGQLWQILTPLANAGVYFLIFGVVLNTRHQVDNFIAYLCTGLFVFTFTSAVVQQGTSSIVANLGLIRALHFPRAVLPIAVMLTQFQNLVSSIIVLVGIVLITGEPITLQWLLLIPTLVLQSLFNAGLALAMARLGAKLTDLKQIIPFVMRTWMYGSGVLYSVQNFEAHLPGWANTIVTANPLLIYIELARHALMEDVPLASPVGQLWTLAVVWTVLIAVGGYIFFWRGEQEYGRG
ncbi:ABC transporter permease [Asanoa iriomotensis]|uniref:Transport permease protein n=1 Tax=Asanoa iriomotensis TaxID=234613 RepID=A0ABQ4CCB9_9ACTN|nr:ABC transporter permease [Asanoa iriomotensis]GIF60418.1 transport permease protein [Asanoa iriomotensis]